MIEKVQRTIPMLPDERRKVYEEKGISKANANKLVQNRSLSDYFNTILDEDINFVVASNLLLGDISAYLNKTEKTITDTTLTKERFIDLVNNVSNNTLTSKNLKDILTNILEEDKSIKDIIRENGVENITDTSALNNVIEKIISENEESVTDYKNGHDRAIKYLMGQVMKETKGSANPKIAMEILLDKLK